MARGNGLPMWRRSGNSLFSGAELTMQYNDSQGGKVSVKVGGFVKGLIAVVEIDRVKSQ